MGRLTRRHTAQPCWLALIPCAAALFAGACSRGGLGSELDGRRFVSESARGHELVKGSPISIRFGDGELSAESGCNEISGTFRIERGVLHAQNLGATEMACMDATSAQEAWLHALLKGNPTIALKGDRLTLTTTGAALTLRAK